MNTPPLAPWVTTLILAASPTFAAETAAPRFALHPLFTDHAVLQRDLPVPVWGQAKPGTAVTVTLGTQRVQATANAQGDWKVQFAPLAASAQPLTLTAAQAGDPAVLTVHDVLVGDVWICSGQSNMEWPVSLVNDAEKEIAAANHPQLRLFQVPKKIAYAPESTVAASWANCTSASIPGFSAVGYFFGRELNKELGVPIGLINSSWGGTIAEAWVSTEALTALPDFRERLEVVAKTRAALGSGKGENTVEQWYQSNDPGTAAGWSKADAPTTDWKEVTMPAPFGKIGLGDFHGIAWFQRRFEVPTDLVGRELTLTLGAIDDLDTTWINGVKVGGRDEWNVPRSYKIPAGVVRAGANTLTVRVVDTGGEGGFTGGADDLRLQPATGDGAPLKLAGPWRMKSTVSFGSLPPMPGSAGNNPNVSTVLYNGMIAPLLPYAVRGAIWYQGESNAGRAEQYRELLPTLIRDWRQRFGPPTFGFHIVSLANFTDVFAEPRDHDWAELREAQALTAKNDRHAGLALAIDIGEAKDIHPRNKQEVGRRLALSALARTYGKPVTWSGPWYRGMETTANGAIRLSFSFDDGGLQAKDGKLTGFAIAGDDRKFVWADATIDGKTVVVSSPKVPKPVAVRYAWDANPVANLYNGAGLPAVPFRTDDWTMITHDKK